jgi:(E)-4-hydroxy-3-methylbut-2-enyl-diphosphate synthase
MTLRGPTLAQDFQKLVLDYIEKNYGQLGRDAAE